MERIAIGIVAAEFNYDITFAMVELAKEHARFLEADVVKVVKVPGVFDMPLAVKKLLAREDLDGVVALGAVIEGSTEHDEIVAQHASRKIADLALEYGKPVGLGITGPGMSRLEAHQRVDYAKRAVEAAIKMVKALREMDDPTDAGYGQSANEAGNAGGEDDIMSGFFKDFG
ncbi:MAG: 6,7-dimethyl-8-ribityllumazine synthase [Candidatus Altiarchaeota archaeon]|nr:6,7-dimethyl-8-ribityllumazine synthase [Candidatus Altiarchaeota archaeon]